jgi:formylglycine-generating enzyme required for sulfatase activity
MVSTRAFPARAAQRRASPYGEETRRVGPGAAIASDAPRVLRGGSWNNNPDNCRSANRNRNGADNRNNNVGFRVASTALARFGGLL